MDTTIERLNDVGQTLWLEGIPEFEGSLDENFTRWRSLGFTGVTESGTLSADDVRHHPQFDGAILSITRAVQSIDAAGIHEHLILQAMAQLADAMLPEFTDSRHARGFVTLPVTPELHDNAKAIRGCARRLVRRLLRPNVIVQIPGTAAGIEAVSGLIRDGVSLHVTNLLDRNRVAAVHDAYVLGLEQRVALRQPVETVRCMAGINISGIDSLVDSLLDEAMAQESNPEARIETEWYKGRAGIATARLAAAMAAHKTNGPKWNRLQQRGANPLTLIWERLHHSAVCSPLTYFRNLMGPNTIAVMPLASLAELIADIAPNASLLQGFSQANSLFADLAHMGLDLSREMDAFVLEWMEDRHEEYLAVLESISEKRVATSLST